MRWARTRHACLSRSHRTNSQARLQEFVLDTPEQVVDVEDAIARIADDSEPQTRVERVTTSLEKLNVPGVKRRIPSGRPRWEPHQK